MYFDYFLAVLENQLYSELSLIVVRIINAECESKIVDSGSTKRKSTVLAVKIAPKRLKIIYSTTKLSNE